MVSSVNYSLTYHMIWTHIISKMFYDNWCIQNIHWMFNISYGNNAVGYNFTMLTMTWCTQPWCHVLEYSFYNLNSGSAWSIIYSLYFLNVITHMFPIFVFALLKNRPVIVKDKFKYKICTNFSKQTIHYRGKKLEYQ